MARIISVRGHTPDIGTACFLAEDATIIGDVTIGDQSSIWFQCVIRGDVNAIRIGRQVNVQDGTIIHCTYERSQTIIGDRVSIGHRALLHGCVIEEEALIGMGAILLDHAHVEKHCLIAAGALVTEHMHCESGWIYAGVPARPIKKIAPETLAFNVIDTADRYVKYAQWYRPLDNE